MRITTDIHDGDTGLTVKVDGLQTGTDPEVVAAFVSDAVAEALQTLWGPVWRRRRVAHRDQVALFGGHP